MGNLRYWYHPGFDWAFLGATGATDLLLLSSIFRSAGISMFISLVLGVALLPFLALAEALVL